ncbi:MAG: exodeoxyribonuclease VII small subunit [Eubacteriales bacterium]|nr:exodeoxyribonuclease VII small subunit [Eubacteriales bacterium]
MASKSTKKEPTFEEGLGQLENMAEQMERSDLPLEELMKLYESGVQLANQLSDKLNVMKASMEEIKQGKNGKPLIVQSSLADQMSMTELQNGREEQ